MASLRHKSSRSKQHALNRLLQHNATLQNIRPSNIRLNAKSFVRAWYNKKFELMLTGRAKAYSSSCSQTVSLSPAISSRLLRGYRSLMPSCGGFLEPRKSRLGLSKSTFNADNFLGACLCLSQLVSAQFALAMCLAARDRQKSINPYFGVQDHSRSLNWTPIESQCKTSY